MNTEIIIPNTEIKLKRARLYVLGGILVSTNATFNRNLVLSIAFTSKNMGIQIFIISAMFEALPHA